MFPAIRYSSVTVMIRIDNMCFKKAKVVEEEKNDTLALQAKYENSKEHALIRKEETEKNPLFGVWVDGESTYENFVQKKLTGELIDYPQYYKCLYEVFNEHRCSLSGKTCTAFRSGKLLEIRDGKEQTTNCMSCSIPLYYNVNKMR
jgi:hypothetical protein